MAFLQLICLFFFPPFVVCLRNLVSAVTCKSSSALTNCFIMASLCWLWVAMCSIGPSFFSSGFDFWPCAKQSLFSPPPPSNCIDFFLFHLFFLGHCFLGCFLLEAASWTGCGLVAKSCLPSTSFVLQVFLASSTSGNFVLLYDTTESVVFLSLSC